MNEIRMINELRPGKESVSFKAIMTSVTLGKTNGANKSNYLNITLQDKSGTLDAKLWAAKPEQIEKLKAGLVVDVVGDVIKYNDDLQLKIEKVEIFSDKQEEQVKYLKDAPYPADEMGMQLLEFVATIQDEEIRAITQSLYDDYFDLLLYYPAASRNHHEFVSGLAYHTLSMCQMAKAVADIHPTLNRDYLYSGILLHDIGKVIELSGPVVPEYTLEGRLLGHISIGARLVACKAQALGISGEKVTILCHLVLAHHGKLEYGSPVLPVIKEAEVIYLIDNLDARINMMDKALENVEDGHFSKRIFPLDNRSFYKPNK